MVSKSNHRSATSKAATKAFERAWKLLEELERELGRARKEEAKRARQLRSASGEKAVRRQAQLDAAVARAAQATVLLTELSELIAANARAQAGQTVRDMAHEAAQAVRSEEQAKAAQSPAQPASSRRSPAKPRQSRPAATAAKPKSATAAKPTAARTTSSAAKPPIPRARRSLQPGSDDPGRSSA